MGFNVVGMKSCRKAESPLAFISAKDAATGIAELVQRRSRLTFLCGAGISVAPPAIAPAWQALRDGLFTSLLGRLADAKLLRPGAADQALQSMQRFESSHQVWIKPEVAMHWFHRTFGNDLFEALEVLRQGEPNANHMLLACLARRGKLSHLITTNFDLYLEQALALAGVKHKTFIGEENISDSAPLREIPTIGAAAGFRLVKVHGTLAHPSSIQATLEQVGRPFSRSIQNSLMDLLRDQHVVVVGYSGNDFDVFPLLQAAARSMASLTWITRTPASLKPDVARLRDDIVLAAGDLNQMFRDIGSLLGVSPGKPRRAVTRVPKDPLELLRVWASRRDEMKVAYTLSLFSRHVGFTKFTEDMCMVGRAVANVWKARFLNVEALAMRRASPQSAIKLFKEATNLGITFRQSYPGVYSNIVGNIGSVLHETGRHREALACFHQSDRWAKIADNPQMIHQNYDDIGNCLRALGHPRLAIRYHRRALRFHKRRGNLIAAALALNNLGLAHSDLRQYRRSYRLFVDSVRLKRIETADMPALLRGLLSLGTVCIHLGHLDEARQHFSECRALGREVDDKVTKTRLRYALAWLLWSTGDRASARRNFRAAETMARRTPLWFRDRYRLKQVETIRKIFRS